MNWQIRVYNPASPSDAVSAIWNATGLCRYSLGADANSDLQIPSSMSEAVKEKWSNLILSPDHAPKLEFTNEETYKMRTQSLFEGINFLLEEQLVIELKRLD